MRVLILQDHLRNGGTERQSVLLANTLANSDEIASTLLTFRPNGILATTLSPSTRLRTLQPFDTGLDWFAPRLRSTIAQSKPDVILCMGRMANCYSGFLQRAFPRTAVVNTLRTGKKLPWLYRWSLQRTRHTIANSLAAARALELQYRVPPEKISLIYNTLLFDKLADDASPPRTDTPPTLLCVAMFRPEKKHRALIEIVSRLPASFNWHLRLVGDGPTRPACERLARQKGIAERVHFTGFLPDPRPLYCSASVAVLTSHSESLPNFLIEAHAHALPSVAYDVGGTAECGGIVVPAGNQDRFLAELSMLLTDDQHRAASAAAAKACALSRFSSENLLAYQPLFRRLADENLSAAACP
ncbi:MAG: glycosyltransferase [Puniceicoccales bacterium]|jgi:glycosyltransferase involved in cell wall biosynthesis|nr:glycosyltransferase [Puniceicoccales bacterium]